MLSQAQTDHSGTVQTPRLLIPTEHTHTHAHTHTHTHTHTHRYIFALYVTVPCTHVFGCLVRQCTHTHTHTHTDTHTCIHSCSLCHCPVHACVWLLSTTVHTHTHTFLLFISLSRARTCLAAKFDRCSANLLHVALKDTALIKRHRTTAHTHIHTYTHIHTHSKHVYV